MEKDYKILYHYCSMETFYSIINHKNIRLSDSRCTNDYSENIYILNSINDVLSDKYSKDDLDRIMELRPYINYIPNGFMPYIACFSETGDLLSQWRAYGDNGNGVAIGFKISIPKGLPNLYAGTDIVGKSLTIEKVIYDFEIQKKCLKKLFHNFMQDKRENAFIYGNNLKLLSYIFKQASFSEEREWRIINSVFFDVNNVIGGSISQLKFRPTNNALISFLELPIDRECGLCEIEEVILGPKNNTISDTLHKFLEINKFSNVQIKKSIIPFR